MTQIHFPAHPLDFIGKTGAGDMGDAMMDVDYNVGLITGGAQAHEAGQQHPRDVVHR
ncbi:MAG: hypothetical protein IPK85_06890 [Gemmatimonadetes bacterium]|nr:hypothetical protein [Gemmatimonadota bacterium]